MSSIIWSGTLQGLEFIPIAVEVDVMNGKPGFTIVGLADTAIKESRDRVKSALKNSGFPFPRTRVTANLAPGNYRKAGTHFDLPIALGILQNIGAIPRTLDQSCFVIGELGLNGELRGVPGVLPLALGARTAGIQSVIVPDDNANEAATVSGLIVYSVKSLAQLTNHLCGRCPLTPHSLVVENNEPSLKTEIDFSVIFGQSEAKRALEISAVGKHNLLLSGPPGSGKTLLARSLPSILPPLSEQEAMEVSQIWSLAGLLPSRATLLTRRPFRSPHHPSSSSAIIGGGSNPKPGEVTLSHRGVLFCDEFPEFSRATIENLRQPLEDGFVTICRVAGSFVYPARFILIAAQNPCPCGLFQSSFSACRCSPLDLLRYDRKVSGPIRDRIDLHVCVPRLPLTEISSSPAETSANVRARVIKANARAQKRLLKTDFQSTNELPQNILEKLSPLSSSVRSLLIRTADQLKLSARGFYRGYRVAQTIADLAESNEIAPEHVLEALHFRESSIAPEH